MKKIALPQQDIAAIYGAHDVNLKHIESLFGVGIRTQGDELIVEGEKAAEQRVERMFDQLTNLLAEGYELKNGDVKTAAQLVADDGAVNLRDYFLREGQKQPEGTRRRVNPKSPNQRRYLEAIERFDIVFGVGPAGTGKTYLAMAQAVSYLLAKKVTRIILARPAVEAGEKLGFLPGDLQEKVNRALRHDGHRARQSPRRARDDRGGADCLHARPHAERCVRDSRRSAEHHVGADEDVSDAARVRLEGGGHGRHHADRSAAAAPLGPGRSASHRQGHRRHRVHLLR
jgi:PhoH-like protein